MNILFSSKFLFEKKIICDISFSMYAHTHKKNCNVRKGGCRVFGENRTWGLNLISLGELQEENIRNQ